MSISILVHSSDQEQTLGVTLPPLLLTVPGQALSHHPTLWASPPGQKQKKMELENFNKYSQRVQRSLVMCHTPKCLFVWLRSFQELKWFEMATKGPPPGATCAMSPHLSPSCDSLLARKEHWWMALPGMTFPKEKALSLLQKLKFFVVIPGKWSSLKSPGYTYKDIDNNHGGGFKKKINVSKLEIQECATLDITNIL